ncbi:hypothetical protein [Nocardia blacklockiae]|uniref:hypothetical protein n=1 Tax=Nocardia blacklockiae TaxID=480036 RepID=UPI0018938AE2|nr:hypothetical protein [Nocardia blacklockiae]MBF6170756.1 hypothetical protein [Nocardia blacklockiae]
MPAAPHEHRLTGGPQHAAWRAALADCRPTRIGRPAASELPEEPVVHAFTLPESLADRLRAQAARIGLTLDRMIVSAWALVLSHVTASADVLFGTSAALSTSGPGSAATIGAILPVRARLRPGDTLAGFANGLHAAHAALLAHGPATLRDLEHLAGMGELFDTAVLFADVPLALEAPETPGARQHSTQPHVPTDRRYAVLLVVDTRAERPAFRLVVRADQVAWFGSPAQWWDRFYAACTAFAVVPGRTVAATDLLPGDERHRVLGWSRGGPHDDTGVLVLDAMLRPTPPMVAGEIYLTGDEADALAPRSGAVAERVVACPFGPPGARMYRTGAYAWWDRLGVMHFHPKGERRP